MPAKHHTARQAIYQIRCLANGKIYIGSAVNFVARWTKHRNDLSRGLHHSSALQNAWNKYGPERFVFEVIEVVPNKDDLIRVEQQWIDWLKPHTRRVGYNVCPTAGSALGRKQTAETKEKLSRLKTGITKSDEAKSNISEGTRRAMDDPELRAHLSAIKKAAWTPEKAAKLGESRRGIKQTPERIERRASMLRGRPLSPELVAKMSESRRGKKHTEEAKAKIRAAMKARVFSEEHRLRLAEAANRRQPPSEETRLKMSESAKRRRAREKAEREALRSASGPEASGGDPDQYVVVPSACPKVEE